MLGLTLSKFGVWSISILSSDWDWDWGLGIRDVDGNWELGIGNWEANLTNLPLNLLNLPLKIRP